jgi:Na+-transporting methylmalonyl-CoA/oxaloacetate decarboxylase beta subunit
MRSFVLIAVAFPIVVLVLIALLVRLAIELIGMYSGRE